MAEAEDVIQDAARHAAVFARDLWRRHRKDPPTAGVTALRDQAPRLDFLLTAIFGRSFPLKVAEPPAHPTFLTKVFRAREGPAVAAALPATDGNSIWLPASIPQGGLLPAEALYRVAALQQAGRAHRGSPAAWRSLSNPVQQAYFHVFEAHAADLYLVGLLPGMAGSLEHLRNEALANRPDLHHFPPHRQAIEQCLRTLLRQPLKGDAPALADVMDQVLRLTADVSQAVKGRLLYRDCWTGDFRAAAGATSDAFLHVEPAAEPRADGSPKSARLARSPQVRQAPEDEDDRKPGAWMVQTAQPHEQAEDPLGMQKPSDRDESTAAEELADALSELPQARLVSTPGRPKEILLSEDGPESGARQPARRPDETGNDRLRYPEWDHRLQCYRDDAVTVHLQPAAEGPQAWANKTLNDYRSMLQLVRRRFEMLKAQRVRLRKQDEGDDVDVDAYVDAMADLRTGLALPEGLYQSSRRARRDMAILVLTDVSGSTDGWVSNDRRVVDVEREALLLVAIALQGMREPYALQAFSGEGPHGVVVRELKRFDEPFNDAVARRIAALEPEHYTRAGAALRHATATLMTQTARHRLLLLLSDGKPNDIDDYEGPYGVEDMRQAVTEARLQGINCFCLTIDRQAASYLPGIFGPHQYGLLPRPERLPTAILDWMKRLVQG